MVLCHNLHHPVTGPVLYHLPILRGEEHDQQRRELERVSKFLRASAVAPSESMDGIWLSASGKICQIEHYWGQRSTGTWVIEASEFKFKVRSDLLGHLEVTMASEATRMAITVNIHMDIRV